MFSPSMAHSPVDTPMVPGWIATCSCGWQSGGGTLEDIVILVKAHDEQASKNQVHGVTITGRLKGRQESPPPPRR
jgi:hypothetical protein